ncbi:MAG: hypothetical protein JWN94_1451 [Betaproteobacteria bacterium]|nr:hypothetical protein [Betaproteobacteria bacterium]
MKKSTISLRRRHLMIAGVAGMALPVVGFGHEFGSTSPAAAAMQKLIVSGRVVAADGKPIAGANVATVGTSVMTDGDGRFVFETVTPAGLSPQLKYQVSHASHGTMRNELNVARSAQLQRDEAGTWRASVGVALV